MEMEEIIEKIKEWIEDFDANSVHSEDCDEEKREQIAADTRERAEMKINRAVVEDRIELWGGDIDEALSEYSEEIIRDAYHEALMNA